MRRSPFTADDQEKRDCSLNFGDQTPKAKKHFINSISKEDLPKVLAILQQEMGTEVLKHEVAEADSVTFVVPQVFSADAKDKIDINIDRNLPHMDLLLGLEAETSGKSFTITIGVDSMAALTIGNLVYILRVIKLVPWAVKSISCKGNPIELGGIVTNFDEDSKAIERSHTASLTTVVTLWTPYQFTSDGGKTWKKVSIKIACGSKVSAPVIGGLTLWKPL